RVSSLTFSGLLSARDTVIGETPASRATSSTRTVPALRLRPPAVIGRPRTRACLSPGKPEAPAGQALALLDADDFVPLGGAFRTRHRADLDLLRAEPHREMAEAHVLALARAARLNGVPPQPAGRPGRRDQLAHRAALIDLEQRGIAGAAAGGPPDGGGGGREIIVADD